MTCVVASGGGGTAGVGSFPIVEPRLLVPRVSVSPCPEVGGGPAPYVANAVNFLPNPSFTRLTHNGNILGGVNTGKAFTLSVWVAPTTIGAGNSYFIWQQGNGVTELGMNGPLYGWNGSQWTPQFSQFEGVSNRGSWNSPSEPGDQNSGWHHWLIAGDWNGTPKLHVYRDGVDKSANVFGLVPVTSKIGSDVALTTIGMRNDFASPWRGGMSEFWYSGDTFLDITQASVRAKFRSLAGKAVNLGPTGALPGAQPHIYLKDPAATWGNNSGTGGNFTIAGGALGVFPTAPTD